MNNANVDQSLTTYGEVVKFLNDWSNPLMAVMTIVAVWLAYKAWDISRKESLSNKINNDFQMKAYFSIESARAYVIEPSTEFEYWGIGVEFQLKNIGSTPAWRFSDFDLISCKIGFHGDGADYSLRQRNRRSFQPIGIISPTEPVLRSVILAMDFYDLTLPLGPETITDMCTFSFIAEAYLEDITTESDVNKIRRMEVSGTNALTITGDHVFSSFQPNDIDVSGEDAFHFPLVNVRVSDDSVLVRKAKR